MSGKFIVMEGIDKSGKGTQSRLLVEWLNNNQRKAVRINVPIYETYVGNEIKAALYGKRDYSAKEMQMLYALNRYEVQERLRSLAEHYDYVVLDRYSMSGWAYGIATGLEEEWLVRIQERLITPSMGFLLDVPVSVSMSRKRGDSPDDTFESNEELLSKSRSAYIHLAQKYQYVILDGEMDKEVLHETVKERMIARLGL